ncbi:F-box/kelch-repeat protein OR23-like [Canna indica]|uniref:F-box/kelch-repeat protein OR23-like n=1 Tax=Canna indica TaxID=4628 RepID=A0AAQ3KN95_9LILI|nr:F-box/kelch-repeat protein OR23-like [Canna indica]
MASPSPSPSTASLSTSTSSSTIEPLTLCAASGQTLIPGLPDDIAVVILASLPYSHQSRLRATSRSWRAFLSPRVLLPLRRSLRLPCRHLLALFPADPSITPPCLFDPAAIAWAPLPPIPCSYQLYGLSNFVPVAHGHHLYVIGGSQFDARSYPIGHPIASAAAHRLDLTASPPLFWNRLADMNFARGSFACVSMRRSEDENDEGRIIVAGGGSRHSMFPLEGSRMRSVECYDVQSGEWSMHKGLPRDRAGCTGLLVRRDAGEEEEFWVMGGYGDYRPVSGVVPADVYCKNAVVLGLRSGKWREVENMWEEGERRRLGVVAGLDGEDGQVKEIFMLSSNEIFRYDFSLNRWIKESNLRRKISSNSSCGFVGMNGELYVLTTSIQISDATDQRRALKKRLTLEIQIYNPQRKKWRFLTTSPPFNHTPFNHPVDFRTSVTCTIRV